MRQYTPLQIEQLRKALNSLLNSKLYDPYFGICFNLYMEIRDKLPMISGCVFVKHYGKGWKYHTGNSSFPVPEEGLERNQKGEPLLWEGRQLELRQDLIKYMLNKLDRNYCKLCHSPIPDDGGVPVCGVCIAKSI